jgi:hypothetical protein
MMRSQLSFRLWLLALVAEIVIASSSLAQTATSTAGSVVDQITVKLTLVLQSEVCQGRSYKPGPNDCPVTKAMADRLERKFHPTHPYPLPVGKPVPLPLEKDFHNALAADISIGGYAVLLEFEWGYTLSGVVDMVHFSSEHLPEFSDPQAQYRSRHWYTHRNAVDFDPDKRPEWQVTLNNSSFPFYISPYVFPSN